MKPVGAVVKPAAVGPVSEVMNPTVTEVGVTPGALAVFPCDPLLAAGLDVEPPEDAGAFALLPQAAAAIAKMAAPATVLVNILLDLGARLS